MCVHLYVHINACVYVCVYIPMCVSTYVQHGEWGICLLQRVGICYHGGWGVQRATVWQVCESPQCSSYLTEDTKLGVNAMPSSLKAGGCEPEKSRCFHLSLKEGAQCSSSSRGSGFPLPLTQARTLLLPRLLGWSVPIKKGLYFIQPNNSSVNPIPNHTTDTPRHCLNVHLGTPRPSQTAVEN